MKILNYGSLNIDYVFHVERAVRPGESMAVESPSLFAGGKGLNQSVAAARAGAQVYHAGKIGSEGLFLIDTLKCAGVDTSFVKIDASLRCGGAYIQLAPDGQNTMIIAGGANRCIMPDEVSFTLSHFEPGDVVMLQNEINLTQDIVRLAHERGLKLVYNPSPITDEVFKTPLELIDLLIVNEDEGKALTGLDQPRSILIKLSKMCAGVIVLTLGRGGSMAFDGKQIISCPAYSVKAVDTTGAGDTYTGYLVKNYFGGLSLECSMDTAARASAIAVTKAGAAASIPSPDEVRNYKF